MHQLRPVGPARQGPRDLGGSHVPTRGDVPDYEDAVAETGGSRGEMAALLQGSERHRVPRRARPRVVPAGAEAERAVHRIPRQVRVQGPERPRPGDQRAAEERDAGGAAARRREDRRGAREGGAEPREVLGHIRRGCAERGVRRGPGRVGRRGCAGRMARPHARRLRDRNRGRLFRRRRGIAPERTRRAARELRKRRRPRV